MQHEVKWVLCAALLLNGCGSDDANGADSADGVDDPNGADDADGNAPSTDQGTTVEADETLIEAEGDADLPSGGSPATSPSAKEDCNPAIVGLLRDFSDEHPNFEDRLGNEKGIVEERLGDDRKPVFAGGNGQTVTTASDFDQWYRDTPGVNESFEHRLDFETDAETGNAVYDNPAFFPLDDRGFGNQDRSHNYHFTFELHMRFRYDGGEIFTFTGDDDLFVFINDQLVIDLGGVHFAESQTVDLDESAEALGLEVGEEYPIDFFHAERHTGDSNFRIETTLSFTNCKPIILPGRIK